MTNLYKALADILEYPDHNWGDRLEACRQLLASDSLEHAATFDSFYQGVRSLSLSAMQERYTQTFDLNPVCTLEVGYHLFGETYKRGMFLAHLRETETPYQLGQEHQLPDYLPVMLRLVDKLDDRDLRFSLIVDCLIPAIEKMCDALSKSESIYHGPLTIIAELLKAETASSNEFFCHVNNGRVMHV